MHHRVSRSVSSLPWAGCVLGSALSGCLGGQTGGEEQGTGGRGGLAVGEDSACQETTQALAVDAASPLGFSAAEVLAQLSGRRSAPLFWNEEPQPAAIGPERGQSSITLEVLYGGGAVRWVEATSSATNPSAAGAGAAAPAVQCGVPRVELDVLVKMSTTGGALDEQFGGTLAATAATRASLFEQLRLDALSGTFSVNLPEGNDSTYLDVSAWFDGGAMSGVLSGAVTTAPSTGENASSPAGEHATSPAPLQIRYAAWPTPNAAPPP